MKWKTNVYKMEWPGFPFPIIVNTWKNCLKEYIQSVLCLKTLLKFRICR